MKDKKLLLFNFIFFRYNGQFFSTSISFAHHRFLFARSRSVDFHRWPENIDVRRFATRFAHFLSSPWFMSRNNVCHMRISIIRIHGWGGGGKTSGISASFIRTDGRTEESAARTNVSAEKKVTSLPNRQIDHRPDSAVSAASRRAGRIGNGKKIRKLVPGRSIRPKYSFGLLLRSGWYSRYSPRDWLRVLRVRGLLPAYTHLWKPVSSRDTPRRVFMTQIR